MPGPPPAQSHGAMPAVRVEDMAPVNESGTDLGRSYQQALEGAARTDSQDVSPAASVETATLPASPARIVEALLFVGGSPLTPARASEIVRGLTAEQFEAAIASLNQDYRQQGRPY